MPLGLQGTKDKVPPTPFSSTTLSRKALEGFSKEKGTGLGFPVPPGPVDYEELRKISTEAAVMFSV